MKVAIPVSQYHGLDSPVHGHFGSAPCFAVVDTATLEVQEVRNGDTNHVHGACNPVRALAGLRPDAVLVGGIGRGALAGLQQAGIAVCCAPEGTVAQAVRLYTAGELMELDDSTCGGHGAAGSCHCAH